MGTEGRRARSHALGKRRGRFTVHVLIVMLAVLAVTFAAKFPTASNASSTSLAVPDFTFSGLAGNSNQTDALAYFRTSSSNSTNDSVAVLTAKVDSASIRAAGGVPPTASFSSGVTAAAVNSGEQGAGIKPLADIVDPQQPFVLYSVQPGDTVSAIAAKFGIKQSTLSMNNPEVSDAKLLITQGQQLIIPRKDGILYKVEAGDTVDKVVAQYD
ncbi:MAG: LysM domain-containing protein, partial [Tepidiformaceae bacterium]